MKFIYLNIIYGLVVLWIAPVTAQIQIKNYEHITNDLVNDSGTALTYFTRYNEHTYLVVKSINSLQEIVIANPKPKNVLTDKLFIGQDKDNRLFKWSLTSFKKDTIQNVLEFFWDNKAEKLFYLTSNKELFIEDLKNGGTKKIADVKYYSLSLDYEKCFVTTLNSEAFFYDLNKNTCKKMYFDQDGKTIKRGVWNKKQNGVTLFLKDSKKYYVYKIGASEARLVFENPIIDNYHKTIIDTTFFSARALNEDKFAIGIKQYTGIKENKNSVEIWKGNDKGISPVIDRGIANKLQLGVVDLQKKKLINLYDSLKMNVFKIDENDNNVYVYQDNFHEDFTQFNPKRNVFIYNNDFSKKSYLTDFSGSDNGVFSFKEWPYLFYYKDKNWWYYDIKHKKQVTITDKSTGVFYDKTNDYSAISSSQFTQRMVYGGNDKIFLNDLNDIWTWNFHTKKMTQLTSGNKMNRHYAISLANIVNNHKEWGWSFDVKMKGYKNIVLEWVSVDYTQAGIDLMNEDGKVENLIKSEAKISQVKRSENYITYIMERYNLPPVLYLYDIEKRKAEKIFESNKWDTEAKKVISKYIRWKSDKGVECGAIIRFPTDYDPTRKYPAILNIYEKKHRLQYNYTPLNNVLGDSFNYRDYIKDGYFVIEPDLNYEIGNVGRSASQSLIGSTNELLKMYPIDKDNIGIIGHSFGAYEVNFIITQTDMFKTAVSCNGISDLVNAYTSINWSSMKPDMWRMESQQYRMFKPLSGFEKDYISNSPILNTSKIKTPLLIWAGKKDTQVNWQQSVNFFLTLKRAGKVVNLLLYPQVEHSVSDEVNGNDIAVKMKDWFDFYLKQKSYPDWLQ